VLAGLVSLLAASALLLVLVAENLDGPFIKSHIQALARSEGHVDLDFDSLRLRWLSGLTLDGLVVRSPDEFRAFAPDLVRVGRIDARWSLSSLFGAGPHLQTLTVSDVTLTVVVDESGRTSFDALSPPPQAPSPPSSPLSRQANEALRAPPPVAALDVSRV
jgi:uncharacterized protein involved in outer membrane biogenesis